jgi:hypothetical protein
MTGLRLNLGCGAKRLEGYINIDKFGDPDLRIKAAQPKMNDGNQRSPKC